MSVRVLIADDNEMVRRGIKDLLASEMTCQICGEAKDGADAVQKSQELRPHIILLDISMPQLNGLQAARLLRKDSPEVKILVMSRHDPVQSLPRAMEAAANGCVDKSRIGVDLLPAIRSIDAITQRSHPDRNAAD